MTRKSMVWSLRFGLRTLFVSMAIVASILAWRMHNVVLQRRAVAAIERLGGSTARSSSWWPGWIVSLVGEELVTDVEGVVFTDASDQDLDLALQLPYLRSATILSSKISDDGLVRLAQQPSITEVRILAKGANLSPAGVNALGRLPNLRSLYLSAEVTLDSLPECGSLSELVIDIPRLTGSNMASVLRLTNLSSLSITSGDEDDVDLEDLEKTVLGRMTKLERFEMRLGDRQVEWSKDDGFTRRK